jgi:hypothetical protein
MELHDDFSTPLLSAGSQNEDQAIKLASFDTALEASSSDLKKETAAQVKRPRGRPRKVKTDVAPPVSDSISSAGAPETPAEFPPMDFKPMLKQGLGMPFKMWSIKSQCPKLELEDKDLEAPCEYANQILNYYAPKMDSMDPGKTATVMFCISMLMLVAEKNAVLSEYRTAITTTADSSETEQKKPPMGPPHAVTSAFAPSIGGR